MAVGTTEGLFMVSNGTPDGPIFAGSYVPAFLQLGKRYYVATIDPAIGPTLQVSEDGGQSWSEPGAMLIRFPPEIGERLVQVCQLQGDRSSPASPSGDLGLFAGVEPAALFRSRDGVTFELVRGLWDHPDRPAWELGSGGFALHTVLTHRDRPNRIIVGIADAGVYRSDDGGDTWQSKSSGLAVRSRWRKRSSLHAHGVHKLAFGASGPDVLFAQTATGVSRTEDAGDNWVSVGGSWKASAVASEFGFPVPLENAEVTGDAFTVGEDAPYPLAFGTRAGELFASLDCGENWRLVVSELPPVLCVRVLE